MDERQGALPEASGAGPGRRWWWLTLLVAAAGAALSVVVWQMLVYYERRVIEGEFRTDADARVRSIERQFEKDLEAVDFLSAFYVGSQEVERDEFHAFAGHLLAGHNDIQALAWVPRVAATAGGTPQEARARYEQEVRQQGYPEYQITEESGGRMVPAGQREEYYPVCFVEPMPRNRQMLGFDLASEAARKAALTEARDKAGLAVSGRITVIRGRASWEGLLVVAPIYRRDAPVETPQQRRDALAGFVACLVRIGDVVKLGLDYFHTPGVLIQIVDNSPEAGGKVLFTHPVDWTREPPVGMYHDVALSPADRKWSAHCIPSPAYVAARDTWLPMAALLAGLLMTCLITLYTNAMVGRAAQVEQLVFERAAEIRRTNARLEREIAERQRAEAVIRDSQALYSSLVEHLPVQVIRKDLAGRFTFANKSFCRLLGKPLEEIVGKSDFDFYPPELAQKYQEDDRRVAASDELFEGEEENKKDGETRYVHVLKSAVHDASGKTIGTQVVFWDITKRKRAEAALEQERYLLHALMDNLPHNIYFKDSESRFIRINKALANCFGLEDASQAMGRTDFDFFTDEHARQARSDEQEIIRSGQPVLDKEEKETWLDGHATWAASTKLPLFDAQGRIVGTFGISRDITVQKQAAEALRAAKEAAESASRAKSDFLANMSHEIRTPLNAIIGMTELLLETELASSQREYLRMVQESGESLLLLINDILDFSKIEAGKLELDRTPFDLREALGDTLKSLAVRAHSKGLELACEIHSDVPDSLLGDVGRLRQIVVNLVGNAVKFTEAGEVVLDVARQSQSGNQVLLHFAVSDTGIGIPKEKQRIIFDAFEQADTSTTRRFGGSGLGLTISARLVQFMGGQIWVESEMGQGSTFHFTAQFDLAQVDAAEAPSPRQVVLRGMRVLVVDDNATNRRILQEMLASWEMQPATAPRARHALDLLREAHRVGEPFGLVVTDANMPEMDGFTLAERIKQDDELSSTVIMMLTSGDRPGDVARCEELGIAAYLLKPVKQSELFDAIVMALGISAVEEEEAGALAAEPLQRLRPLRVLLAEDSLVNQKLAVGLLEAQGHTVFVANNGREAITELESREVDLLLMDVQMPEMDGLEATAAIRDKERLTGKHVPIIAMTAHALRGDRERCLAAGMDDYIAKPIRARRLMDTIAAVLGVATLPHVQPQPQPSPQPQPPSAAEPLPAGGDELDWSAALSTVKGDRALLRVVIEAFLEESPRLMAAIRQAVARGDTAALRVAAHALKGSTCYFGARRAFDDAYRLEKMGQSGTLDGAQLALSDLEGDVARLTAVLVDYVRGRAS